MEMYLRAKTTTRITILTVAGLLFTGTKVSSNPLLCSFARCARKTLELNVTDSPVVLPCDNLTVVNTTTNRTGNYSYCHNENLLVNQSTSYFTLDYDRQFDKTTVCCYNHDIAACGVCYDLTVYYAPTNQDILSGPVYQFNQPYTAHCDSEANPPPSCRWFRESLTAVDNDYVYEFIDDGSGNDLVFDSIIPITDDVVFENNGCTIHFPKLEQIHNGHYFCIATNLLGRGIAGLPTIILYTCRSQTTNVVSSGSSNVEVVLNETLRLSCTVSPASDFTIIQFIFNNTIYRDANYVNVSNPSGITVNSVYHNENCSVESSLIIENFSQHFIGEYSCSSFIFGNSRVVGNNVTFNVTLISPEEKTSATASDSDGNNGLIIGIPLAAMIILIIVIIILIIIQISMKKRANVKYPPPPSTPLCKAS